MQRIALCAVLALATASLCALTSCCDKCHFAQICQFDVQVSNFILETSLGSQCLEDFEYTNNFDCPDRCTLNTTREQDSACDGVQPANPDDICTQHVPCPTDLSDNAPTDNRADLQGAFGNGNERSVSCACMPLAILRLLIPCQMLECLHDMQQICMHIKCSLMNDILVDCSVVHMLQHRTGSR